MRSYKYELVIWWSDDDDAFVVEVPDLPGCMAHGASLGEAVANSQEAIAFWIEGAKELGRPIPKSGGRRPVPA